MTTAVRADAAIRAERVAGLEPREVLLGVGMAGTSGAAVLAHTFGPVPMSFTVPFVVFPSASLLVGAMLARQRRFARLHRFSELLARGAIVGLAATLLYDAVRPLLVAALGLTFDPFRAIPIFGTLITGLPANDPLALAAGWIYHYWNGISFGMMFALLRPAGGIGWGVAWALTLQVLMMIAYPTLLRARLDDPAFMASGLIGHSLWGMVVGAGIREWSRRD
jgi:hypothetical protein